jgi:hypothetical protein
MLKKPHTLALMIFGICLGISLFVSVLEILFSISLSGLGLAMQLMAAYSVGRAYGSKFQQPISHQLKLWTSIYHALILTVWTSFWLIILTVLGVNWTSFKHLLALVAIVVINILLSPLMYWLLGEGCKESLKKLRR